MCKYTDLFCGMQISWRDYFLSEDFVLNPSVSVNFVRFLRDIFNLIIMKESFSLVFRCFMLAFCVALWMPSVYAGDGIRTFGSDLSKKSFDKYWRIESESKDYKLRFIGDTVEIIAPEGLTMWRTQKLHAPLTIEYDAMVVVENDNDRLSDLNCFWMASDPASSGNFWKNSKGRGKFLNCYGMQLYYLGYGGNSNSTTRFRRYDGDARGIHDASHRPAILKEYTDKDHLLKANKWYHIKITSDGFRTQYFINGERLVDYRDPRGLKDGYFGFRTTKSRTRFANFRCEEINVAEMPVPLHWIGKAPGSKKPVTFGVPFDEKTLMPTERMELTSKSNGVIDSDQWPLAFWPDGSVKWLGVAATIPANSGKLTLNPAEKKRKTVKPRHNIIVSRMNNGYRIASGETVTYISGKGETLIDSIVVKGRRVAENARLLASTVSHPFTEGLASQTFFYYYGKVDSIKIEKEGRNLVSVRFDGKYYDKDMKRGWLPFVVRLYFFGNTSEMRMTHTFIYDGDQHKDFIKSLGMRFDVPMRDELYNRHVAFSCADGGVWSEPVQPLVGRRIAVIANDTTDVPVQVRQMAGEQLPPKDRFDEKSRKHLENWASWNTYRLSQLSPDAFSIRKRAHDNNSWVGTFSGTRSAGFAFAGDVTGGLGIGLEDFWQAYPSTLEVSDATSDTASLTVWLWSPESEPMDLRHYDNKAHDLDSSYEDVQEGMSDPYGIARTSSLVILPTDGYKGKEHFAGMAADFVSGGVLIPTPVYLHDRRAFGIWSLPDSSNEKRAAVEQRLTDYMDFYADAIDSSGWYGFWNYGDVMHAYDHNRHDWMYDVGGYAWDNTELASPMWLWYNFLRNGDARSWRMAKAMTRHNGDVDVYHIGPNAGLGSRHNVSHWGCGAKEGRISQAAWNRFLYYLAADDRAGDLMSEVKDADQMLYTLDPMRLAQPRGQYPCTAPARLRFGPDWLSYAGNWMTEWERTGSTEYRDKIIAGMKSIVALPGQLFQGPLALGYDPSTGVINTEADTTLRTTNHLMTIMGGFEINNEMIRMVDVPGWEAAWRNHADRYKEMAQKLSHNKFRVSRLAAYAAFMNGDAAKAKEAWHDLLTRKEHKVAEPFRKYIVEPPFVPAPKLEVFPISTNDAALWSLDAIYMQEVIPQ